jgi:hypothetical protein
MRGANAIRPCRAGSVSPSLFRTSRPPLEPPARHRPFLIISNRESLRLEIHATHTKQTPAHRPNRENNEHFINHDHPISLSLQTLLHPSKIHKALPARPSFLFRVESTPTLYFLPFTANSNWTHVSGRPPSSAPPSSRGTPACAAFPRDSKPKSNPKNTENAPPNSVSIKTQPHPLFSTTYAQILIAPCFDYSPPQSESKSKAAAPHTRANAASQTHAKEADALTCPPTRHNIRTHV